MKFEDFESMKNCVFNDLSVNVKSQKEGFDFTLKQVNNKIEVVKHHQNDSVEVFFTFRNGDDLQPDLENFLSGWVETINSDDCVVNVY
jgi:hypothetical protein